MWFGPGEYVPYPTEEIIDVNDLPAPQIVTYDRNQQFPPDPKILRLMSEGSPGASFRAQKSCSTRPSQ